MLTAEDVAVVRRLYVAVAARSPAAIGECFDEEAVWHLPGTNALSVTHRGWPAIRDDLLAKQGPISGGTFRAQLLDLAVGSEYIVAIVHATAERAGYRLDQTVCQLMRVRRGKIVEVRGHYADEAALNAFWGPATGTKHGSQIGNPVSGSVERRSQGTC
jgi:ketosteroid isomerase-like protein